MPELRIDLSEQFPRLRSAPVVEAVIAVGATADSTWDESVVVKSLKAELPDYPSVSLFRGFQQSVTMREGNVVDQSSNGLGWQGLQFVSADKLKIAKFNRDEFLFSRLAPYEHWDEFQSEGLRLWRIHGEHAKPAHVQRIGLRFINRIPVAPGPMHLEDFLKNPPLLPGELPLQLSSFFDRSVLSVPNYPYEVNTVLTLQPSQQGEAAGLILDIAVTNSTGFDADETAIVTGLSEMRWLKNKIFFGSITDRLIDLLK